MLPKHKNPSDFFGKHPLVPKLKCKCCCFSSGLIDIQTNQRIPLIFLKYDIEIVESLAYITLNQEYFNDSSQNIETLFFFSITNDACFYDFEAKIDDIVIKGEIKEKEEAKADYEANRKKYNTVAYSEIDSEIEDVIKIKIGNIPPKKTIYIKFQYIQQLEICLNKFWRLTIPSTLTPRYESRHQIHQQKGTSEFNNIVPMSPDNEINKYHWDIKTTITSHSPIVFIKSPSHSIKTEFCDKSNTKCLLSFQNEEIPNKDYTILFKNDEINKTQWTLAHSENDEEYPYCAMLSFFPQFNSASDNDAYEAYLQNSVKDSYKVSALKSKGEFVFILDRSGSMSGNRIQMAIQALQYFLKSIPPDSYFNVVSFGSSYNMMFNESKQYSEEIIEKAIQEISLYSDDLGGTELYYPLKAVFEAEKHQGYPKNLFVLTDGDISNTKQVLELIAKNNEGCRVYTIGIGNGCSNELIVEGANAGKGKHEFIADNDDMNEKIIGLLKDSLSSFLTDIRLQYDESIVQIITPLPENLEFIRKNETVNIFVFFNKKFTDMKETEFKLSYINSLKNERDNELINIKINDMTINQNFIHKYGLFQMIKRISRNLSYEKNYNNDIYLAKKDDICELSLKMALKFQILTSFTAFICVIKEKDPNNQFNYIIKRIEIPSIESNDYSFQHRKMNIRESRGPVYGGGSFQCECGKPPFLCSCDFRISCQYSNYHNEYKYENYSISHTDYRVGGGCGFSNYGQGEMFVHKNLDKDVNEKNRESALEDICGWGRARGKAPLNLLEEKNQIMFKKKQQRGERGRGGGGVRGRGGGRGRDRGFYQGQKEKKEKRELEIEENSMKLEETMIKKNIDVNKIPESNVEKIEIETNERKDVLTKIVSKQKAGGYWEVNSDIISLMGLSSEKTFNEIPPEIKSKEIWLTILIIFFLNMTFPKQKGSWMLISQKAEEYLEDNNIDYLKYQEKILEQFK